MLNTVTLKWDLTDLIEAGLSATLSITPTAQMSDSADHILIPPVARPFTFAGGVGQLAGIVANDNAAILPAGTGYLISVTAANGQVIVPQFQTQLLFANGATQWLDALATVPVVATGYQYQPLAPGTPSLGDTYYGGAAGAPARLPGNTTATRKFWRQAGTGTTSAAPAWDTLQAGDIPSLPFLPANAVLLQGADPTGATFSDAALATAKTALGSSPGVIVVATPGTYKFANSYTFGPGQGLIGTGVPGSGQGTYFNYTGNSVFLHTYDPAFNTSNTSPLVSLGGPFNGFIIDGTGAGASAKAFQLGDQNQPNVNIGIRNFTGASAIGAWLCNTVGWTNYGSISIATENCTNHVVFDNAGGTASFGGVDYFFTQTVQPNQIGVATKSACQPVGGEFQLYGGYIGGVTNSGRVLSIGEDGSNAGFRNLSSFNVGVECEAGAGTVGPVTIALGSTGFFMQNTGQMFFRNQGGNFQASVGVQYQYRFSFSGWIESQTPDGALGNPSVNGFGLVTQGGSLWSLGSTDATHIYLGGGDFYQTTLVSGANTVAVANTGAGRPFKLTWHVIQPASGAAGTLTLTGAKTTAGGGVLTLSSVNGEIDVVDVWSLDGTNVFAAVKGLNFH